MSLCTINLVTGLLLVFAATGRLAADTFTVTNTNDSGVGSLRQAIRNSNASIGTKDTITFNIPGTGVHTIVPNSELPSITDPVVIDATTQGNSATPLIELDGTNAGGFGGDSTIKGFAINRFSRDGIYIINNGGNTIQGNFIGTNPAGTVSLPNREFGVFVDGPPDNLIGGTTSDARNLVSGTIIFSGVAISGATATNNRVEGNYIGTDVTGTIALGNSEDGVYVGNSSGVRRPGQPSTRAKRGLP